MGLFDTFKRWRLAQKGLSTGKKRRQQAERAVVGSMDRSVGVRVILYIAFVVLSAAFVFNGSDRSVFENDRFTAVAVNALLGLAAVLTLELQSSHRIRNNRVILILGAMFVHLVLVQFVSFISFGSVQESSFKMLLLPYALSPLVLSVLVGGQRGVFATLFVTVLGALMVPSEYLMQYMVLSLLGGLTSVMLTKSVRRRGSLLRAGFYAGVVILLVGVTFGLISAPANTETWKLLFLKATGAVGVSVLVSMVVSGVLPALESLFGITTDISWLESSDLNHKLLRKMQLECPGTFHHSLVVASLAEAAAEQVGANAIMCRVCSYFHDIGKMSKPEYFIENQGAENPHDTLTPTMSALVIIAHVKDGVDLAVKHKLNPRIVDVIREHHGDSLVYYFWHKAREQLREQQKKCDEGLENVEDLPEVDTKNFRYPGPRPSTKESGIISLADAIESASRTIKKPAPGRITALVNDIVAKRINEGQLDDSGLTMNEISLIRESFITTLRSMLHSRIDYPKDEKVEKTDTSDSKKLQQDKGDDQPGKPPATREVA